LRSSRRLSASDCPRCSYPARLPAWSSISISLTTASFATTSMMPTVAMLCLDVNVLVYAVRPDTSLHSVARTALDAMRSGTEPVALLPEVAVGFLRVVTNRRIFTAPETLDDAIEALKSVLASPLIRMTEAGPGRWSIFEGLVRGQGFVGGDIHDALLASACIDMSATLVTADRGFARFKALDVRLVRGD
jgi:toxin-antitoxin system PIN domain toxin